MMIGLRALSAATCLCATLAMPGAAQHEGPDAAGHVGLVSANALIGGLAAGLTAWARGEDVPRALLVGAAGGSLSYAGKVTATARFSGAAIAGRQVAAVGHSMIANVAAGKDPLAEVWLPLSPARVRLPVGSADWGLELNLSDILVILYGVFTPELDFDTGLTLRYGTPVFVATDHDFRRGDEDVDGVQAFGTIILSGDIETDAWRRSVLAHEMVHVIQDDFAKAAISYPVERWALGLIAPGWTESQPLRGGFAATLADQALSTLANDRFPDLIEREAQILVRPAAHVRRLP